jgi:hypothetical protein
MLLTWTPLKANILIDQTGQARLADFGLVTIISDYPNLSSSSSHTQGGTARWMSPELIDPQRFGFEKCYRTKSSDCYALGMVVYETISGRLPFHQHADMTVFVKILAGEHPARGVGFAGSLWNILKQCWAPQPNQRPSIEDVSLCLERLRNLPDPPSPEVDEETESDGDGWDSMNDSLRAFSRFVSLRRSRISLCSVVVDISMHINGDSHAPSVRSESLPPANTHTPVPPQPRPGPPPRSLSLAPERTPQESGGGCTASDTTDVAGRDSNRTTIKPVSYSTTQRIVPPPLPLQSPLSVAEKGHAEIPFLWINKDQPPSLPSQPLEGNYMLLTRRTLRTASSDVIQERERTQENSKTKPKLLDQRWRAQQQETEGGEKQREAQRRPRSKSRGTGGADSWFIVPSDIPPSDYKNERPTVRGSSRPLPPRRGHGFGRYSSPRPSSEGGSPRRTAGTLIPNTEGASGVTPDENTKPKTKPKVSLTPPSLTYRGNRGMENVRTTTAKHPIPPQSGKPQKS